MNNDAAELAVRTLEHLFVLNDEVVEVGVGMRRPGVAEGPCRNVLFLRAWDGDEGRAEGEGLNVVENLDSSASPYGFVRIPEPGTRRGGQYGVWESPDLCRH